MKLSKVLLSTVGASAGLRLWGALVEVNKLRVEKKKLALPDWPEELDGFRIGFLADFHLRDAQTISLAKRAITQLLAHEPDLILLGGDFVSTWMAESPGLLADVFQLLDGNGGRVFAVPGNRDYRQGFPELLEPIFNEYDIRLLRNESTLFHGINIVGVDSANAGQADPIGAMEQAKSGLPTIVLWHEPDMVEWVPAGAALVLSGHSHGGQFVTPWGWAPVTSKNGQKYLRGFYPNSPTPLYVNRGLGTTGPPSRLFCTPEVSILDLYSK